MRTGKFSIAEKADVALQHLKRNVSVLPDLLACLLLESKPVTCGTPFLIAYDSVVVDRIENFQWSPYCGKPGLTNLLKSTSQAEQAFPSHALAYCCMPQGRPESAIFPIGVGARSDGHWDNEYPYPRAEMTYCGERVFHVAHFTNDAEQWVNDFTLALSDASNAGSLDVGFCTTARWNTVEWSEHDITTLITCSTRIIATALDGDGYIVWEANDGKATD